MKLNSDIDHVIENSVAAFSTFKNSSRYVRSFLLQKIVLGMQKYKNEIIDSIVHEAKKPRKLSEIEFMRGINTFTIAAEEAKRLSGEIIPLDLDGGTENFSPAHTYCVPKGPLLAITPFNFPLNLVAHKVAPALAVGLPIVLKPAPQTPKASFILKKIFDEILEENSFLKKSIPQNTFQVINADNETTSLLVKDQRFSIVSFTGSEKVGWDIQKNAVGKKVILELGGNAAVIVHHDADLQRASQRIAFGAFAYAGQICISVQRVFVHEKVADEFQKLLIEETSRLKPESPENPDAIIGPVINNTAYDRVLSWIKEAEDHGARVLIGGKGLKNNFIEPTILTHVDKKLPLSCEEVFGPVLILNSYSHIDDAIHSVNDSKYGLQAGIFTQDMNTENKAIRKLDVGGIIINEIPTFRADHMPYGGMKNSGLGREGVKYTMQEYCELKTTVRWFPEME